MSFIHKVINDLLIRNIDFSNTSIILPNKRPIIFFKRELKNINYNGFLPKFITIDEFLESISGIVKIETIPLWLEAFQIQKKYINPEEKLDYFLKWIPTILKDFNDIDLFSDNPERVLSHLCSIERIENWGNQLAAEDSLFFKNIEFWKENSILYKYLHSELSKKEVGTKGFVSLKAFENIKKIKLKENHNFIFVGLNALNPIEEKIIKHLLDNYSALLYWDSDKYYMKDETQEAGFFLRKYRNWKYYLNRDFNWIEDYFYYEKKIKVVGVSQEVSQAKYASNLLASMSEKEISETALVLCDENILPVVLESLPKNIDKVNITMGHSLKNSSLAIFFKNVFKLHIFREKNQKGYYFQDVLNVLESYNYDNKNDLITSFKEEIVKNNKVFISYEYLHNKIENWKYFFVFENYSSPIHLILKLFNFCEDSFWEMENRTENQKGNLLKEYFLKFKEIFLSLYSQISSNQNDITTFSLLYKFYQHIINNIKIDFIGEPLEGLQIMGLLETRLLSFKNVIMLNVNEGIIPLSRIENSFIPFDVKKNYKINTFLEGDAIFAYHFYRLLQHAESVNLVYNNFTEGLNSGEKSRFINQLGFENKKAIIQNNIAVFQGNIQFEKELIIEKTPFVLERIKEWLNNEISPTHLTSYNYNQIDFYLQRLLKIKKSEDVEEEISALRYGSLIHNSLEYLYKPEIEKYLTEPILKNMLKNYKKVLQHFVDQEPDRELFLKGQNYLQKLLAEKTIKKIIEKDLYDISKGNTIFLKDIEINQKADVYIESLGIIKLNGIIDRWDVFNGKNRVVDYKSSMIDKLIFDKDKLEIIQDNKNFKFYIQLVFYCYMMLKEGKAESISSGIWSFKKASHGVELLYLDDKSEFNFTDAEFLFEEVKSIIKEIADGKTPFVNN